MNNASNASTTVTAVTAFSTAVAITAAVALLAGTPAQAAPGVQEVLTPAQYFECQIAARQATIVGLQERAAQGTKAGVTNEEKRVSGERARERVHLAMYGCGKQNAETLGAYAHRNADELQTWLNANPQVKARLDEQARRVASLSAQMPAVSPSAKR
jgi:nitrous oxidase accessory protein NosD